jgi:hypothetical protein
MDKKAKKAIKARGNTSPAGLVKVMEELTGKTLDQLVKEAPKKELRFIGGSTFYGTKEDFDKWSKTGVRF